MRLCKQEKAAALLSIDPLHYDTVWPVVLLNIKCIADKRNISGGYTKAQCCRIFFLRKAIATLYNKIHSLNLCYSLDCPVGGNKNYQQRNRINNSVSIPNSFSKELKKCTYDGNYHQLSEFYPYVERNQ